MCNLSWTPHSNLEKDNSLKTTPVLAQRWAVWSILTKNHIAFKMAPYVDAMQSLGPVMTVGSNKLRDKVTGQI